MTYRGSGLAGVRLVWAYLQRTVSRLGGWFLPAGSWVTFYATFLGALLGVAGAFLPPHFESKATEKVVLRHVYCELEGIRQSQLFVALAKSDIPQFLEPPIYRFPQVEFWEAVTGGGTLHKVSDPALAFTLASAYSEIRAVRRFLGYYTEAILVKNEQPERLALLVRTVRAASQLSLDRIDAAQLALKQWVVIDRCV